MKNTQITRALRTPALLALGAAAALALAGCGAGTEAASQSQPTASSTETAASVTVSDAWVKATDGDMSAMFGVVHNGTGEARTIVSASTDVASMVQLHETVASGGTTQMQEKEGGFALPAGGSLTFEPGGDHVMLMGLTQELAAGDDVKVTLTLDNGSTVTVDAPVKTFSGAQESYAPSDEASSADSTDMSGMDH